jgi:hypothetical protein
MTRDDIIRMAREAGLGATLTHNGEVGQWIEGANWTEELERFAALVAAAERKACAKVCEAIAQQMEDEGEGPTGYIGWVIDCVAAIRARSKT